MLSYKILYQYVNTISSIKKVSFKIIDDIWLSWDLVAIEPPISYYYYVFFISDKLRWKQALLYEDPTHSV